MRFARSLVVLCGLLAWPAETMAYSGTDAEQQACTGDVFSLCSSFIPNEEPILACLQSKPTQLSPACYAVLFPEKKVRRKKAGPASAPAPVTSPAPAPAPARG